MMPPSGEATDIADATRALARSGSHSVARASPLGVAAPNPKPPIRRRVVSQNKSVTTLINIVAQEKLITEIIRIRCRPNRSPAQPPANAPIAMVTKAADNATPKAAFSDGEQPVTEPDPILIERKRKEAERAQKLTEARAKIKDDSFQPRKVTVAE